MEDDVDMASTAAPYLRGEILVAACLALAFLPGCSSKSPCTDPRGDICAKTNAYANDDPRSVCHVCCESAASDSDAWTELNQTDTGSAQFTAIAAQNRPYGGQARFLMVAASWNGAFFVLDDNRSNPLYGYHLFTRGRSDEGNLQVYFNAPGDGPINAAPLNCNIARN